MTQPQSQSDWTIDGPAFPARFDNLSTGMSLRQWYAGQAIAGICSRQAHPLPTAEQRAAEAFHQADMMLAAEAR